MHFNSNPPEIFFQEKLVPQEISKPTQTAKILFSCQMETFQRLLASFIRDPALITQQDDLSWKLLNRETLQLCVEKSAFDIDFLSITGSCKNLIQDSRIEALISAGRSKIFKKCSLKHLKGSLSKSVFIFAECGDYLLGKPVEDELNVECDDYTSVLDIEEGALEKHESLLGSRIHRQQINNRLQKANPNSIAFRDIIVFIQQYFINDNLVLYRYGQKQSFESCASLIEDLSLSYHVDIALAVEIPYQNNFLSLGCGSNISDRTKFYSNFLSNVACNFILKGSSESNSAIQNSYRIVGYNSIQHRKLEIQKK